MFLKKTCLYRDGLDVGGLILTPKLIDNLALEAADATGQRLTVREHKRALIGTMEGGIIATGEWRCVPEPSALALLVIDLAALGWMGRRKKKT